MVSAILARWRERMGAVDLAELYRPALAGFATDTGFGRFAPVESSQLRYFKHMLVESGVSLEALLEQLRFRVPQSVWDLAVNGVLPSESEERGPEIDALRQLEVRGVLVEEQATDGMAIVAVPRELLSALVALGRVEESSLVDRDVLYALKKERMTRLREAGASVTVLLTEGDSGRVWVSVRSRDGSARELAEHLGGGGHDRAAGASLQCTSLDEARDRVIAWLRSRG
jgi:nanoRNase/pAp phosphatase (c-di-AMP/oligoRNAs hydrolase)